MKKIISSFVIVVLLCLFSLRSCAVEEPKLYLNLSNAENGIIKTMTNVISSTSMKILIIKDLETVTYNTSSQRTDYFPLQMGNGIYTIKLLQQKYYNLNIYTVIFTKDFEVKNINEINKFTFSNQFVDLERNELVVQKTLELTKNTRTDIEKILIIHNYIIKNISYDYNKAVISKYLCIPNLNNILLNGKGICLDYSALTAAMLRVVGIPTKLNFGYSSEINGYHAWNEFYLKDYNKWFTIDTTADAVYFINKQPFSIIKDSNLYDIEKSY